jgi:hypothetical protein
MMHVVAISLILAGSMSLVDNSEKQASFSLREAVRSADFIFHGRVTKVEYVMPVVTEPDDLELPHTFVTFSVMSVAKGGAGIREITLRFAGGSGGIGSFVRGEGIPLFDVGDEDVLFVRDNGISSCPLVGCGRGRLRLIHGAAYDDDGREVYLDDVDVLTVGRAHPLPEVRTHRVAGTSVTFTTMYSDDDPINIELPESARPRGFRLGASAAFGAVVRAARAVYSDAELGAVAAPKSQDPRVPFRVSSRATPPPEGGPSSSGGGQ